MEILDLTSVLFFNLAVMLAVVVAGLLCLRAAAKCDPYDRIRFLVYALMMYYFFILYLIALFTTDVYLIRSGILTRTGIILLAFAISIDAFIRIKRCQ
jgi:hypothetical protein